MFFEKYRYSMPEPPSSSMASPRRVDFRRSFPEVSDHVSPGLFMSEAEEDSDDDLPPITMDFGDYSIDKATNKHSELSESFFPRVCFMSSILSSRVFIYLNQPSTPTPLDERFNTNNKVRCSENCLYHEASIVRSVLENRPVRRISFVTLPSKSHALFLAE